MNKIKILAFLLLLNLTIISPFMNINSEAIDNGIELVGAGSRETYGSTYWHTSNIREWLNSEGTVVNYTNNKPSYANEVGFLNGFSDYEKNQIAITNTSTPLMSSDAKALGISGSEIPHNAISSSFIGFSMPKVLTNLNNIAFKQDNDKVFLLSGIELLEYYQQRNWDVVKSLTSVAKQKYSIVGDYYEYFTRDSKTSVNTDVVNIITNTKEKVLSHTYGNYKSGIVPALHIKPDTNIKLIKKYSINDLVNSSWTDTNRTIKASSLEIGDIVEFGTYMNTPIKWRVISFTNGYPLLCAEEVLDIKQYDAVGDTAWSKSNIIFENADVTLPIYNYESLKKSTDSELPVVQIVNKNELNVRQEDSFSIQIKATDNVGISHIILPNGQIVKSSTVTYTITENGYFTFKAVDVNGNCKYYIIPVGNINSTSDVIVEQSETNWTNKDVTVDIQANNDINFNIPEIITNKRDTNLYDYPNYTSYANKRFMISADIELNSYSKPLDDITTGFGYSYNYVIKSGEDFSVARKWVRPYGIKLSELQSTGKVHFEGIITVPGDYFDGLYAWTQINVDHLERAYSVKFSNITYTALDVSDFAITKIQLPNGSSVNQSKYTDTISQEGIKSHTYTVYDNRNMTTQKTITTKIDKTAPLVTVTGNPTNWTNESVELNINVTDNLSGIKEIITPYSSFKLDGVSSHKSTIQVNANENLIIKVVDIAGNVKDYTINVNKIDKTNPTLNVSKNINSNLKDGTLTIEASDSQSGIKYIELPNGNKINSSSTVLNINANGKYPITVYDNVGNKTQTIIDVTELSKSTITGNSSGISRIEYKLSGATTQDWTTYTSAFYITNEGTTTITARSYDNAGNISSEATSTVKLDKTKPINGGIKIELN